MNNQKIKNLELNHFLNKSNLQITKWNILELLKDEIYVELNPKFVNSINYKFKNKGIRQKILARRLNVSRPTVNQWLSSVNKMPYKALIKFSEILDIDENTITKNITGISLDKGRLKIFRPNIIIKFDKHFARLLGHIYGDGSVSAKCMVSFTNLNKDLIADFIISVKNIFGDVDCYIYKDNTDGTINVTLPKCIGIFLIKCFSGIRDKKIPVQKLLDNKETINEFVGSLFDGEGYVSVKKKQLEIQLSKSHMLKDLIIILNAIDIETSPIRKKVNRNWGFMYRISICRRKNIKKFYESTDLKHKTKKELIQKLLNSYSKKYANYELREAILMKLRNKSLTSSELAELLKTNLSSICKCLTRLEVLDIVKKEKVYRKGMDKERYMINLWSLK